MVLDAKSSGALILRLLVGLALLACPKIGNAQGTWSVIATFGNALGQVDSPAGLAVDASGNLYVSDGRIQKRDAQESWSLIGGFDGALAVDTAGNLYVAGGQYLPGDNPRIRKRYAQGSWSAIDGYTQDLDQEVAPYWNPTALAVDAAGNLYVASLVNDGGGHDRIQKRDAQGNWSVIATFGQGLGQVNQPSALAVDPAGNLYVADTGNNRVLKYAPGP